MVLAGLVKARGWQRPAAEASLFGRWEHVVGSEVADHCRPVKLERGELTIEAESTAWATQLRLLAGSLLKQIAAEGGHDIVTRLRIHGPAAPSHRGPAGPAAAARATPTVDVDHGLGVPDRRRRRCRTPQPDPDGSRVGDREPRPAQRR